MAETPSTTGETTQPHWAWGCLALLSIVGVIVAIIVAIAGGGDDDKIAEPTDWSTVSPVGPAETTTTSEPPDTRFTLSEQQAGEQAFVALLKSSYPQYAAASTESVIAVGRAVCDDLASGKTYIAVSLDIAVNGTSISATDGATIAGMAIGAMCEQYKYKITE